MKRDFLDLMQEILGYFSNVTNIYETSTIIDHISIKTHEKRERITYFFELLEKNQYISVEGDIVGPTQSGINYLKELQERNQ